MRGFTSIVAILAVLVLPACAGDEPDDASAQPQTVGAADRWMGALALMPADAAGSARVAVGDLAAWWESTGLVDPERAPREAVLEALRDPAGNAVSTGACLGFLEVGWCRRTTELVERLPVALGVELGAIQTVGSIQPLDRPQSVLVLVGDIDPGSVYDAAVDDPVFGAVMAAERDVQGTRVLGSVGPGSCDVSRSSPERLQGCAGEVAALQGALLLGIHDTVTPFVAAALGVEASLADAAGTRTLVDALVGAGATGFVGGVGEVSASDVFQRWGPPEVHQELLSMPRIEGYLAYGIGVGPDGAVAVAVFPDDDAAATASARFEATLSALAGSSHFGDGLHPGPVTQHGAVLSASLGRGAMATFGLTMDPAILFATP